MTTVDRTTKSLLLLLGALLAATSPARAQSDATTPAFAPMAQATGGFGAATQWVLTMSTAPGSGFVFVLPPSPDT